MKMFLHILFQCKQSHSVYPCTYTSNPSDSSWDKKGYDVHEQDGSSFSKQEEMCVYKNENEV